MSSPNAARERETAILALVPMAERIARARGRKALASFERLQDMKSDAILGAINAVDSYDPSLGVPIEAHAQLVIHRAISAGQKKRSRQLTGLIKPEFIGEGAAHEIISAFVDPVPSYLRSGQPVIVESLNARHNGNQPPLEDSLASNGPMPEDLVAERDMHDALERAVVSLPPADRRVIEMRFYRRDGSNAAVAEALGVSHQRASEIAKRAFKRLRVMIGPRISREDVK
jgi:RNA polymerase sigma factor (sigma-70 family)